MAGRWTPPEEVEALGSDGTIPVGGYHDYAYPFADVGIFDGPIEEGVRLGEGGHFSQEDAVCFRCLSRL